VSFLNPLTRWRILSRDLFDSIPRIWNRPIIGGALSRPAERFPNVFGNIKFFKEYPYFLPCAVPATFTIVAWLVTFFFLKEVCDLLIPYLSTILIVESLNRPIHHQNQFGNSFVETKGESSRRRTLFLPLDSSRLEMNPKNLYPSVGSSRETCSSPP
jgi:hypothetical protein